MGLNFEFNVHLNIIHACQTTWQCTNLQHVVQHNVSYAVLQTLTSHIKCVLSIVSILCYPRSQLLKLLLSLLTFIHLALSLKPIIFDCKHKYNNREVTILLLLLSQLTLKQIHAYKLVSIKIGTICFGHFFKLIHSRHNCRGLRFSWASTGISNVSEMISISSLTTLRLRWVSTTNRGIGAITGLGHWGDPLPRLQQ